MPWRTQSLDGALLSFDRESGTNVLVRNERTAGNARVAPRVLQIGLTSRCNLNCHFCYRDADRKDSLTVPFLIDLLSDADEWGVLEVAFGGGEPLLFPGFVDLLEALRAKTHLGLNFTTNGMLLSAELVDRLRGVVGEVRVSAYPGNDYRKALRRALPLNPGINFLVTPQNVGVVEPLVHDALSLGANNVMLLGYKGPEPDLHLRGEMLELLEYSVRKMSDLPLRLDVCWYPIFQSTPHLFPRSDCGAGDELLAIASDQTVQCCSFHHERWPFRDIRELVEIYRKLRTRRCPSTIAGCRRPEFLAQRMTTDPQPAAWVWNARASNNSGDATIVARFCDEDTACRVAQSLRELSRAQEAFLASEEGRQWLEKKVDYDGSVPTPVLRKFGKAHGFSWTRKGEGLCWEEDGCGAPVLTAGAVGDAVVVYHPYCAGLPTRTFRQFFSLVGAMEFGHWNGARPRVIVCAQGRNENAERQVKEYLKLVRASKHPSDVKQEPPWGDEARDPRIASDEDRSARLSDSNSEIEFSGRPNGESGALRLLLTFDNMFAGALAVEAWLSASGYKNITVQVETGLEALAKNAAPKKPVVGIFGDVLRKVPAWEQRSLAESTDAEVVGWLFESGGASKEFRTRLQTVEEQQLSALLDAEARRRWERGEDITSVVVEITMWRRTKAAGLARGLWVATKDSRRGDPGLPVRALADSLPADEAFGTACAWLKEATDWAEEGRRLAALAPLKNSGLVAVLRDRWIRAGKPTDIQVKELGEFAAACQMTWAQLEEWLQAELPLARVAVQVLKNYCGHGPPEGFEQTDTATLERLLGGFLSREHDPAMIETANFVRKWPQAVVRDAEGI